MRARASIAFVLGTGRDGVRQLPRRRSCRTWSSATRSRLANGRLYAAEVVTNQFVGPPLGAFLFTAAAAAPFLLDAASFGIAALVVLGFRGSFRPVARVRPRPRRGRRSGPTSPRGSAGSARHRAAPHPRASSLGVINMLDAGVLAVLRALRRSRCSDLSQTGLRDPARPRVASARSPGSLLARGGCSA